MPGWAQHIITAGAVLGALAFMAKTLLGAWRGSRKAWAEAIAHEVDPKIAAVQTSVDQLRADGERRFDELAEALAEIRAEVKTNGGRSLKDRVEQVHKAVVAEPEIDRLYRERPETMPERRQGEQ